MNDNGQSSLDALYETHFSLLIGKLFKLVGCSRVAEDIAQEAYLRVSDTIKQRPVQYLRAYLYQTAHNLALDHLRKENVRSGRQSEQLESIPGLDELPSVAPGPEQTAIAMQEVERLQQALASLPERRRNIFLLHKVYQMKYSEIADKLAISVSAVEKNMRQALLHCLNYDADEND